MCGIAGFFQTKYDVFNEHSCRLLTNKLTNMKKSIKTTVDRMTMIYI